MNQIAVRAFSGGIYVGIIVALILLGGDFGFPCLCAVLALIGALEARHLEENSMSITAIGVYDLCVVLLLSFLPIFATFIRYDLIVAVVAIAIALRFVIQIYSHNQSPAKSVGNSLLTYCYVALPLALASALYIDFGPATVLSMFLMIWLNDTGAYLVGCAIGKHRLFPRISPKKSWEGFFGGIIFVIAGILVCYKFIPNYTVSLPVGGLIIFGILISIASTWGDLIESMFKRAANVKDSGKIMPGHGGILDRIDSLLLVAPTVWIIMTIFKNI